MKRLFALSRCGVVAFAWGLFLPTAVQAVVSSWVPIGPPGNANVVAVGVFGSTVYAATNDSGVLRTTDGGKTWISVNTGLTNLSVRALTVLTFFTPGLCPPPVCGSPFPVLYTGTYGGGVFMGDGTSWHPVNSGLTNLRVLALAASRSTLYTATEDGGIFRSDDSGTSWLPASAGQPSLTVASKLAVDPTNSLTAYAGGGAGEGLFKTTDGGATWTLINLAQHSFFAAIGIDPSSTVYVSFGPPPFPSLNLPPFPLSISKSIDGGANWQTFALPLAVSCFSFGLDPETGSLAVYAGGSGGVLQSTDGGATWSGSTIGLPNLPVQSLAVGFPFGGTVYAGIPGAGVFASGCVSGADALCVNQSRFQVRVWWTPASFNGGGVFATAIPITGTTGAFWFFDPTNLELVVKVLDGRSINGKFWVFFGALSNVEYQVIVTDTQTGAVKNYFNSQGQLASVADTTAF